MKLTDEQVEQAAKAMQLKKAANKADWMQVALNHSYGPPCFHLQEEEGTFCLRAKSWEGHAESCSHKYVSLADLVARTPDAALLASHKKLVEALMGAQEELRLIRMKDTNVVYDPTIRIRIAEALREAERLEEK